MIGIIDYGLGNLKAFLNVYKQLNISARTIQKVDDFAGIKKLILPGVGSFDYAMKRLNESGIRKTIEELVLINKVPVMGICVGMQMLAYTSEEGVLQGLGWIEGKVKKLETKGEQKVFLPHMGWNTLNQLSGSKLLNNIDEKSKFYFLHSYYFSCEKKENEVARTEYGQTFSCIVNSQNIYGVQFHPEKSHRWGVQILKNFADL